MIEEISNPSHLICPVELTAAIVSGKWTLLIIRDLTNGTRRFCQLERSLQGISPKTLSDRLHILEREGIISRQTFGEVPPRVEYSLTEKGRELAEVIEVMRAFGMKWLNDPKCSEDVD
jgi:DNA-binding HxlR family transcriptional regulator